MIGGFVRGVLSGGVVGVAALVVLSVLSNAPSSVPPVVEGTEPVEAPAPVQGMESPPAPPVVTPESAPTPAEAPAATPKPVPENPPIAAAPPEPAPVLGATEPPATLVPEGQAPADVALPAAEPGLAGQASPVQPDVPVVDAAPPVAETPASPAPNVALLVPETEAPTAGAPQSPEPAPAAPLEEPVSPADVPLMTMPEAADPEAAPEVGVDAGPSDTAETDLAAAAVEPAPSVAANPAPEAVPEAAPEPTPAPTEPAVEPATGGAPEAEPAAPAADDSALPAPAAETPAPDPVAEPAAPEAPLPEPAAPPVADGGMAAMPAPGLDFQVEGVTDDRLPQVGDAPAEPEAPTEAVPAEADADVVEPEDLPPLTREARAFENPEAKPLFAVILIDTGAPDLDRASLAALPFPVSFALDPMDPASPGHAQIYRAAGQEVLMLATGLPQGAQASDVEVALSVMGDALPQAVAVLDTPAGAFQSDRPLATGVVPVIASQGRGVVTWDRGLNAADQVARRDGVPSAVIFRALDSEGEAVPVIRRYLDRAAFKAAQEGQVIVAGTTEPDTVAALMEWAVEGRSSTVALAPVSAVLSRP